LQRKKIKQFQSHDALLVQKLASDKKVPTIKQLSFLGEYLSKNEKMALRILVGIIIISIASLLINIYWNNSRLVPRAGGTYTEGLIGTPQYINPLYAGAKDVDLDISTLVFSSLLKYSNNGLEKDLAESYEVSPEQKSYTFKIKANVLWHDGEKLTADDIIFTFSAIQNQKTKTPLYYNFKNVTLEKVDDLTVKFTLAQPFAPFLESLTFGILPKHIWENVPVENMLLADYNLKPIGSGPFKFSSLLKNKNGVIKSYNLESNPDYFLGKANIDEITFKFYDNFEEAVAALNNKNVDGISYLPKEIRARIINNHNLNFHILELPQYTSVFFNFNNNPVLKDVEIRKILTEAVNKEKIVNEILNAEAQVTNSCVLPNTLGFCADITTYPYNPEEAKQKLEKLGWQLADYVEATATEAKSIAPTDKTKGQTTDNKTATTVTPEEQKDEETPTEAYPFKVRKLKNRYLEFSLTTVNQPENVKIAKELQIEWQQIGAKVNLNFLDSDKTQEVIKNRSYETLLYGQILGYDPDPYPFWHSSQETYPGLNLTSLKNADIDKLLEEARVTINDQDRADKYVKFQKLLSEEVPAVFLFNPTYTYPQNKKIKGFDIEKIYTPSNRFNQVNDWYIKTKRVWGK